MKDAAYPNFQNCACFIHEKALSPSPAHRAHTAGSPLAVAEILPARTHRREQRLLNRESRPLITYNKEMGKALLTSVDVYGCSAVQNTIEKIRSAIMKKIRSNTADFSVRLTIYLL